MLLKATFFLAERNTRLAGKAAKIHSTAVHSSPSTSHLRIPLSIAPLPIRRDPQHIVAPNQHLSELSLVLALDVLDGAAELDVHVGVDADEASGVLGLAPLEADAHVVVDEGLQHGPRVHGDELLAERSVSWFVVGWEGLVVGFGGALTLMVVGFFVGVMRRRGYVFCFV